MRPQLHKLPLKDCSFLYKNWHCDYFDKPWHFHEEYELVMIEKSKGTKFIGEKVSDFEEGDLMLLAPRIPHFFRNNVNYYKRNGRLEASSIFIHFSEDFLGKNFFDLPEMKLVQKLLENAQYAVEIQGDVKPYIIDRLHSMNGESAAQRLVSLLDILVKISERGDLNPVLSSTLPKGGSTEAGGDQEISRINTIFDYITNNFRREIYVHEIAE